MRDVESRILPFFIPHLGCPHRCIFCDQHQISGQAGHPSQTEIRTAIDHWDEALLPEIAFYGGSFTALPEEWQLYFLSPAWEAQRSGKIRGIRISTRPDYIDETILARLSAYGVTTVELGVQSMDDQVLLLAERGHSAAASIGALRLLKEKGFQAGVQLMPGLPGDSRQTSLQGALDIARCHPDLARIYPTLVLKNTPLHQLFLAENYSPWDLDQAVANCRDMLAIFRHHGVKVIRIGLQPTAEINPEVLVAAGPYHPSFGELVAAALFREQMAMALLMLGIQTIGRVEFLVSRRDCSLAAGHQRANSRYLEQRFSLPGLKITGSEAVSRGDLQVVALDHPEQVIFLPGDSFIKTYTEGIIRALKKDPTGNRLEI